LLQNLDGLAPSATVEKYNKTLRRKCNAVITSHHTQFISVSTQLSLPQL